MRVHHVGYRIRGFYRLARFGHRGEMTPKDARHRFNILQLCARDGPAATGEACGVSRRTLYRGKRDPDRGLTNLEKRYYYIIQYR